MSSSAFVPGSAASVTSDVELTVSARSLCSMDLLSASDPFCVVYTKPFGSNDWIEYQRTETIKNNPNPDFGTKIRIKYKFEERQELKFELYDCDSSAKSLSGHDFLGYATCTLAQIVCTGSKIRLNLQIRTDYGRIETIKSTIVIVAEELPINNDEVWIELRGHSLDKKDFFGKSDPFIEIHKKMPDDSFVLVHRTEWIKCTLNPRWKRFSVPLLSLCNGDYERPLKFECFDWNSSGSPSFIGSFQTKLSELTVYHQKGDKFFLINQSKQKKANSGEIFVDFLEIKQNYSFMEYIRGGMQIHCTIAIDFTGSNGAPTHPSSLHYIQSSVLNMYEQAIFSIVNIIEDYDTDKQFPVLGFGARLPPDGRISHEFYVNMNPASPFCSGVNGVLDAYRNCIRQVQLYGPTNFTPVIEHVTKFAQTYKEGNNYFILLILTDGVISDMPQTVQAVVAASRLPISIIIVGLGNEDFTAMEILDGDKRPLESNGTRVQRDIVQFVPFNKYLNQDDPQTAKLRLAKEVLAEIPKQVCTYMKANGIIPNAPILDNSATPPDPDSL